MATIQEILDYVNRKYPNQETTANKVLDLDMIHKDVYMKVRKLSNEYLSYEDVTVANQTFYNFPNQNENNEVRIEDVVRIDVETGVASDQYDTFEYAGVKDEILDRQVYMRSENGTYALFDDEEPIADGGKRIMLYYYPRPDDLLSSVLTAVPELDVDYHTILKYLLIVELANQGHNPDTEIADYWQKKADEYMVQITRALAERQANARTKTNECDEHW